MIAYLFIGLKLYIDVLKIYIISALFTKYATLILNPVIEVEFCPKKTITVIEFLILVYGMKPVFKR